jgi:hypothetical protein
MHSAHDDAAPLSQYSQVVVIQSEIQHRPTPLDLVHADTAPGLHAELQTQAAPPAGSAHSIRFNERESSVSTPHSSPSKFRPKPGQGAPHAETSIQANNEERAWCRADREELIREVMKEFANELAWEAERRGAQEWR